MFSAGSLFGMPVEEHYYIIDATEDYRFILYFYCGFGYGGEYQGALVYGKLDRSSSSTKTTIPALPADVELRFQMALESADLKKYVPSLKKFCTPSYAGRCENIDGPAFQHQN